MGRLPEKAEVFIGVGSNLGDREGTIKKAVSFLADNPLIDVEKISSLIETEPIGVPPQPTYLNGVIKLRTYLSPVKLLCILQSLELTLGRTRMIKNGPRTIDLDILLYGNEMIDTPLLKIPHPRMREREFVLKPLAEIAPEITQSLEGAWPIVKGKVSGWKLSNIKKMEGEIRKINIER